MSLEWDSDIAELNLRKHGIDFADAATALEDEFALVMRDTFSTEEERWVLLGSTRSADCSL